MCVCLCVNKKCPPQRKCGKPLSDMRTHTHTVLLLYCVYCVRRWARFTVSKSSELHVCVGAELMNFDKIFLASWNLRVTEYLEYREVCPYMVICSGLRWIGLKCICDEQGWISTMTWGQSNSVTVRVCCSVTLVANCIMKTVIKKHIKVYGIESFNVRQHYQKSNDIKYK